MRITVIGAGNMGGAIGAGALRRGIVAAGDLRVADPSPRFAEQMRTEGYPIEYAGGDYAAAVAGTDLVVIAVKPWLMEQVCREISPLLDRSSQAVVSIVAGVSFEQMGQYLDFAQKRSVGLYRIVPNTAISLGKSVTFVAAKGTMQAHDRMIVDLFSPLGSVMHIDQDEIPAVTALSSSGIAYALKYLDAAAQGGVRLGVDRDSSLQIVIDTMKGAIALLEANRSQPQEEIDKVTTPGGMTLKGLAAMEKAGFTDAVIKGLFGTLDREP